MSRNRVAVVTGGARGIGRGIALMLGERGDTVHVTDIESRNQKRSPLPGTVEETADEVTARGGKGVAHVVDHTDDHAVDALFARLLNEHAGLDIVVANAFNGNALPFAPAPFWELPMTHWNTMIDAGLRSHLVTARAAAPLLLADRGTLVMTGYALPDTDGGHLFYELAMSGINRMTVSMSHDLHPRGVTVVTVSPGFTATEAIRAAFGTQPLPAEADPVEHVGRVVRALTDDTAAGALSGATLRVHELITWACWG